MPLIEELQGNDASGNILGNGAEPSPNLVLCGYSSAAIKSTILESNVSRLLENPHPYETLELQQHQEQQRPAKEMDPCIAWNEAFKEGGAFQSKRAEKLHVPSFQKPKQGITHLWH